MRTAIRRFGAVCMLAATTACGDLLDVTNPGPIADRDLNTPAAMNALVVGMSADLSVGLSTTAIWGSVWSDDLTHSGTLGAPTVFARGVIDAMEVNPWWGEVHRARWVAEQGIERMKQVMGAGFETSPLAVRAHLLAGFANRIIGENVCNAVFDGGPAEPYTAHFTRAEAQFTEALRLATAQNIAASINAARAGRAQVRAALGRWAEATADAAAVPIGFRYDAIYSLNTGRESNGWQGVTLTRGEYTVYDTRWYQFTGDARIPWANVPLAGGGGIANAANGRTPWVRQQKYLNNGAAMALAKGTEMVLIRAEAALRGGDVTTAMTLMNQVRAHHSLQPLSAADAATAWAHLHDERGKTLWLEGRRFWDLRRWNAETGPAHHPFLTGRGACVPISENERLSNRNLS